MSDPYGRKYVSAGNPYVAADGQSLVDVSRDVAIQFASQYGNDDAPIVYAEGVNLALLSQGRAIQTPQGVVSYENARFAVQKAGYNGPTDPASIGSAYAMLATPAPSTPPSPTQHATAAASVGGLSLSAGLGGIPRPLLYGAVALVAYEFLFARRRR